MSAKPAKALLVQQPKWLPDVSSILLQLKFRHTHAHTHFYFLHLYFSFVHSYCCLWFPVNCLTSVLIIDQLWLIISFTKQWNIFLLQYRHTHTHMKTCGLFMKGDQKLSFNYEQWKSWGCSKELVLFNLEKELRWPHNTLSVTQRGATGKNGADFLAGSVVIEQEEMVSSLKRIHLG